mgnify:CR=1 FL=1
MRRTLLVVACTLLAGCSGGALDTSTPEGRCAAARIGLAAAAIILADADEEKRAAGLAKAAALVELYCAATTPPPTA